TLDLALADESLVADDLDPRLDAEPAGDEREVLLARAADGRGGLLLRRRDPEERVVAQPPEHVRRDAELEHGHAVDRLGPQLSRTDARAEPERLVLRETAHAPAPLELTQRRVAQ